MKGERRKADLDSVRTLRALLLRIIAEPSAYLGDGELKKTLRSQAALAAYASKEQKICAMSLNHQKAMAALAFENYQSLDRLRRDALAAIEKEEARGKRKSTATRAGLTERVQDMEEELSLLREDLILLQRAYDLRCAQARRYAESSGTKVLALCNKEQREIDATLSAIRNRRNNPGKPSDLKS